MTSTQDDPESRTEARDLDWGDKPDVKDQNFSMFFRTLYMIFFTLLYDERKSVALAVSGETLKQAMLLGVPLVLKYLVDFISSPAGQLPNAYTVAVDIVVVLTVLSLIMLVYRWYFLEMWLVKPLIRLENKWPMMAQAKLLELSALYHTRENTGKKVAKVQKATEKMVAILFDSLFHMFPAILYVLVTLCVIAWFEWRISLILGASFILALSINIYAYRKLYYMWDKWESLKESSNGIFVQSLINLTTVQGYVREQYETERFADVRMQMCELDIDTHLKLRHYYFLMTCLLRGGVVLSLLYGVHLYYAGEVSVGVLVFVFFTGEALGTKAWDIVFSYTKILKDSVAAERLYTLFCEDEVVPTLGSRHEPVEANVRFKDVSFSYPGKEESVLNSFSLEIPHGAMVALVGASGAGKTTVTGALMRKFDVSRGSVTLNGVDIRTINRDDYRKLIAPVFQDTEIFDCTIAENVAYAYPDVPEALIIEALHAAHLTAVVNCEGSFDKGLATEVGERGVRLSGGEQQRVGIARAYVAVRMGAKILVLDEATSSLDSESERAVQKFIETERLNGNISIVAVAHRLSTVKHADSICVMHDGELVEQGTHEELIDQKGRYARLVELQNLRAA